MFDELLNDRVYFEDKHGQKMGPISASVQRDKILTGKAEYPLEPGNIIIREMPFGNDERYVVVDPGFRKGIDEDIPDHYQARVRREDSTPQQPSATTIIYNINGNNARLNQNSTDNSISIAIESPNRVFDDLRHELRANIQDSQRLREIECIVDEMQSLQHDKQGMSEKLGQLISSGADLMTVIGPFLPLLAGIASG